MTEGFQRRVAPGTAVRPDINVTPLVDVVLVLLIIFMVVAPRLDQDIPVELPGIFNPDPEVKTQPPFKVSIPKPGEYYVEDTKYDLERLIDYLAAEHAIDPLRRLVLRADARLPYKEVRPLVARAEAMGFPGLSFMVGERHRAADGAVSSAAAQ